MAVEEFVHKTLDLLDKEREAEIQETQNLSERLSAKELERRGVCLRKLQLCSYRSGLYGRMVALFEREPRPGCKEKLELPSNNFSPGDIVGVDLTNGNPTNKPLTSGIVLKVSSTSLSVAFDDSQDVTDLDDTASYKLTKLANDVTYRRLKNNLNDLMKYRGGPAQRMIDTFFCLEEISLPGGEFPFTFVNKGLDESQREAVKFALIQRELSIIHGPPGTGKTTTVVEIILQAVTQGLKVLVTAPSNIAVDNLLERLASSHPAPSLVRLGHPARLMPHLTKYSLDAVVAAAEETDIVKDVRADVQKTLNQLKKARGAGQRRKIKDELTVLKGEIKLREIRATKEVLTRSQVVLSTLTSATLDGPLKHTKDMTFDLVVIDECSQALEAACWIGLLRGKRCVLAGDHLQLPPTILSREAAKAGLELTLMERLLATLVEEKGRDVVRMLTTQYRMNHDIMAWASDQLYQSRLKAHDMVASHLLKDLEGVTDCEETASALLLIDTAGCDLQEMDLPEEISKGNEGEADVVAAHVGKLVKAGVKPADIAVIAPYNMQVDLLRARLCPDHPGLEVRTVDGFQGREKEAVVISMVRSNDRGEVGFLSEKRRINVAVTRARRHLCVVCDSDTVTRDAFIGSLVTYMTEHGDVLSADQVMEGLPSGHKSRYHHTAPTLKDDDGDKKKHAKNKNSKPAPPPLVPKEEKAKQFREKLEKFLSDPSLVMIEFPASLNSHDRMVVHEVAEELGLGHCSVGEDRERHIQVTKPKSRVAMDTILVALKTEEEKSHLKESSTSSLTNVSVDPGANVTEIESDIEGYGTCEIKESSDCLRNGIEQMSIENSENASGVDSTISISSKESLQGVEKSLLTQNQDKKLIDNKLDQETAIQIDTSPCPHCSKTVPNVNKTLHEIHCARQGRPTSASSGGGNGGARKKDKKQQQQQQQQQQRQQTASLNAKEKEKPKEKKPPKPSHVQKASQVLNKIADDDFDALISTITELDGKCAFKKCKTLTTTLGRNCEYCTRRFCLSHLMPEVHGCGDAARQAARRTISREGVLTPGSGAVNKKPNQARRAQLEIRMDKKKEELAKQRKGNKGKS